MPTPTAVEIVLSDEERAALEAWTARRKTAQALALRARIVLAAAVAFLADPARSGFINGAALPVDGGWIADASWTSLRLRTRGGAPPG